MNRPRKRHPAGSPQDWLAHAQSDLKMARLAKGERGILGEQVCFHAQQACEKSLKAVLLKREVKFPLVHDIEVLLELARSGGIAIPASLRRSSDLTPYAVEARYPGSDEVITREDVRAAIAIAGGVVTWAAKIVSSPVSRKKSRRR